MLSQSDCEYIQNLINEVIENAPNQTKVGYISEIAKIPLIILLNNKIGCNLLNDYKIHEMVNQKEEYHIILFTRVFQSSDYDAQELRFYK